MLNIFLLFHKCGNNYILNVHKLYDKLHFISSVRPDESSSIVNYDSDGITNIRCRNFGHAEIQKSHVLKLRTARFLIFTRHPASFILSAAKYHLRGVEEWAVKKPQAILGGKTLTQALRNSSNLDEQHIIIMKQFGDIYKKKASLLSYLNDNRFMRVRCEDIFTATEPDYYISIAEHLRLSGNPFFLNALKAASPAFRTNLPDHATGSFKIADPYEALGDQAKGYFDEHWRSFALRLDYACGAKSSS